jgi:DNA repair protein RadC
MNRKCDITLGSPIAGPDVLATMCADLGELTFEQCDAVYMDASYGFLKREALNTGSDTTVQMPIGAVIAEAKRLNARYVAVLHNHPNGNALPSPQDVRTRHDLAQRLETEGLELADAVVLVRGGFLSIRDFLKGARVVCGWQEPTAPDMW